MAKLRRASRTPAEKPDIASADSVVHNRRHEHEHPPIPPPAHRHHHPALHFGIRPCARCGQRGRRHCAAEKIPRRRHRPRCADEGTASDQRRLRESLHRRFCKKARGLAEAALGFRAGHRPEGRADGSDGREGHDGRFPKGHGRRRNFPAATRRSATSCKQA